MSAIVYPESDGRPFWDDMRHAHWIMLLWGNLQAVFRDRTDVFVASGQLWYPVEGDPTVRTDSDVYVVFGRPKHDRGNYKQWEEGGIPLTVVIEFVSPVVTPADLEFKHHFYERYGVEEYFVYDYKTNDFQVHIRDGAALRPLPKSAEFVSPRLGVRFDVSGAELAVFAPDGRRFRTFQEVAAETQRLRAETAAHERRTRTFDLIRKRHLGQATPDELRELEQLESRP